MHAVVLLDLAVVVQLETGVDVGDVDHVRELIAELLGLGLGVAVNLPVEVVGDVHAPVVVLLGERGHHLAELDEHVLVLLGEVVGHLPPLGERVDAVAGFVRRRVKGAQSRGRRNLSLDLDRLLQGPLGAGRLAEEVDGVISRLVFAVVVRPGPLGGPLGAAHDRDLVGGVERFGGSRVGNRRVRLERLKGHRLGVDRGVDRRSGVRGLVLLGDEPGGVLHLLHVGLVPGGEGSARGEDGFDKVGKLHGVDLGRGLLGVSGIDAPVVDLHALLDVLHAGEVGEKLDELLGALPGARVGAPGDVRGDGHELLVLRLGERRRDGRELLEVAPGLDRHGIDDLVPVSLGVDGLHRGGAELGVAGRGEARVAVTAGDGASPIGRGARCADARAGHRAGLDARGIGPRHLRVIQGDGEGRRDHRERRQAGEPEARGREESRAPRGALPLVPIALFGHPAAAGLGVRQRAAAVGRRSHVERPRIDAYLAVRGR